MEILSILNDERSECFSVLTSMSLKEYKTIAYDSFQNGGNVEGQREVIKSVVAAKIRKRMQDDFIAGAIFPPVVLGLLLTEEQFEKCHGEAIKHVIQSADKKDISIIDGMQRSNIYFNNYATCISRTIRVEFWCAKKTTRLLYRMLVLNTGQVPWNTRRQVEVIFANLAKNIESDLIKINPSWKDSISLMGIDDKQRRTQPGKYQKNSMIEMYMGFNTRSVKVDVNEELANEFQRFDMMESVDKEENYHIFVDIISYLIKLDFVFSSTKNDCSKSQFSEGKDIFTSVPACLGFVVACAEYVLGKNPIERNSEQKIRKNENLRKQIERIETFISNKENILALPILNAVIGGLSKTRIGDEMRITFKNAFSEMIKIDDFEELNTFEAIWRS